MADKLISQLGARAAVLITDLMPLEPNAGPPAEKATIAQLITLLDTIYAPITGGAYVLKAGDTMTGLLTIAQATANTSNLILSGQSLTGANAQSLVDMTGTWNTTGAPTAIKLTITNTASDAAALLMDLRVGASSITSITKAGTITIAQTGFGLSSAIVYASAAAAIGHAAGFMFLQSAGFFFGSLAGATPITITPSLTNPSIQLIDATIILDAADTIAQRNGVNAQAFRWYRTFTNAANYERGALQTAAGQVIVAAETAGTGTDDIDLVLTPAGVGRVTLPGGAQLLKTTAAMTSGAAAALGTLTNAPTAGNAAVWCPIMFNGVQHWFPCWT